MYMWRELDLGEVRADFAHLRDMGFDVVRFFLLTEDFLPAPMTVAMDQVSALVEVARIAREEKLAPIPTLVTINMSGKLWWPSWMCDRQGAPRGLYTDPTLLRSQALLVETCARALAVDGAIRAFDLTNEIDDALRGTGGSHPVRRPPTVPHGEHAYADRRSRGPRRRRLHACVPTLL
jgi:endo-1,4-beta-mannosidase